MPTGRGPDIATLVSWLVTEALGAFMVRSWVASGGARAARQQQARLRQAREKSPQPGGMSLPVLIGHAGLNAAGLLCWIVFVVSGARAASWLALGFLAPAIGLGISMVTIWTPYGPRNRPDDAGPGDPGREDKPGVLPDEVVKQALDDEALARKLVDDLIGRNLAQPAPRTSSWNLRPLVPLGHGVLAFVTFLFAVLTTLARF
jgi:hypothetical protein